MTWAIDVRHGIRDLRKHPATSLTVVLTLALGISACTVIFSVFYSILLKPLPYESPDRLLTLWQVRPTGERNLVSPRTFHAWRRSAGHFAEFAGMTGAVANISGPIGAEQTLVGIVSPEFFSVFSTKPMLGRFFGKDDVEPEDRHVLVISERYWRIHYGDRRSALGSSIFVNGEPRTIVGVVRAVFQPASADFAMWIPSGFDAPSGLNRHTMEIFARLKPGLAVTAAQQEMTALNNHLEQDFPDTNRGWGVEVIRLRDEVSGEIRPALRILMGAVGVLLLIVCTNVANLLLSRMPERSRDVAIRASLGASRGRIVCELMTQNLIIVFAACAVAVPAAHFVVKGILALNPGVLPRTQEIGIHPAVLFFSLAVSVGSAVVFGIAPTHLLLKIDLHATLRQGANNLLGSRGTSRWLGFVIAAEVGLTLVLLIGANILIRGFIRLETVDRGFQSNSLVMVQVSLPPKVYSDPHQVRAFYDGLLERVRLVPGVKAVGLSTNVPLDRQRFLGMYFQITGQENLRGSERPVATTNLVNPDYFKALAIPILFGRAFTSDDNGSRGVAIVSESLARRYWPAESAIGKELEIANPGQKSDVRREIVGVAADVRYPTGAPDEPIEIYLPYAQTGWPMMFLYARTFTDPTRAIRPIATAIRELDKELPISEVRTMDERIGQINGRPRWNAWLFGSFAGIAMLLASFGIYGVIASLVAQRRKEIGVRTALGARRRDLLYFVLKHSLVPSALGIAIGLVSSFPLSNLLSWASRGLPAIDFLTLFSSSALMLSIAAVASYLPALHILNGDPLSLLRAE